MTRQEYIECLKCELYGDKHIRLLSKVRIKYFQPNTNCMYLARKMWYLYERGGIRRVYSKLLYLRIIHRYGCLIFPYAQVGKGFRIAHPVGIVIGKCSIGENFSIYQNCTIGTKHPGDEKLNLCPQIGNNVNLYSGSMIFGAVNICDNVSIGANSVVLESISLSGIYVGSPAKAVIN